MFGISLKPIVLTVEKCPILLNLSKILPIYDQNKKKVCFQKKFEFVTTLEQNVSIRVGGCDGGGCHGYYDGDG